MLRLQSPEAGGGMTRQVSASPQIDLSPFGSTRLRTRGSSPPASCGASPSPATVAAGCDGTRRRTPTRGTPTRPVPHNERTRLHAHQKPNTQTDRRGRRDARRDGLAHPRELRRRPGRLHHPVQLADGRGRRRRVHGGEQRVELQRVRVRHHGRERRLHRRQLVHRQRDRRRARRLRRDIQGLPLGIVHHQQRPAHPGRRHDPGRGHHQLEHDPDLHRRVRRGLRHLVQPDPDHLRPAQRRGDDDLDQPLRRRRTRRLGGRQQRLHRRQHLHGLGEPRQHLECRLLCAELRHHLGQQPRR